LISFSDFFYPSEKCRPGFREPEGAKLFPGFFLVDFLKVPPQMGVFTFWIFLRKFLLFNTLNSITFLLILIGVQLTLLSVKSQLNFKLKTRIWNIIT